MTAFDIDLEKFESLLEDKYLSKGVHPNGELFIWCYTQKCQFEQYWIEETKISRGLITDTNGKILSRPFQKFFNVEEHESEKLPNLPNETFSVYEKLDGSLGISYWVNGKPYIATKGSFESDQAVYANKLLENYDTSFMNPDYTYLWEIIYPENRIVVDYGEKRELILLAVIDTKSGRELDPNENSGSFPTVEKISVNDYLSLTLKDQSNKEGYVVVFSSGVRAKMKFKEYVRLHRLITGVNERTIWDLLKNNQSFDDLIEKVPDEFYQWIQRTRSKLKGDYLEIEEDAWDVYKKVKDLPSRKEQAIKIMKLNRKVSSIVFKMLDQSEYKDLIWKLIRPRGDQPFKNEI